MLNDHSWPEEKGRQGLPVWRLNRLLSLVQKRIQTLNDEEREFPLVWNVMHLYGTMQLSKLIAVKRGLNPELAAIICVFHDIYTLFTGKSDEHASKAEKFIVEIVSDYNTKARGLLEAISDDEINIIIESIKEHSHKNTCSNNYYLELLKDVDSLDSYLHGLTQGRKTGRIPRVNKTLESLGLELVVER